MWKDHGRADAAGTSSDSGASTAPSSPATSAGTPEDEQADVVEWAGGYCTAVTPLAERFDDLSEDFTGQTPEQIMQTLIDGFQGFGPAFTDAGAAVSEVGVPPIDGGQEVADALEESFTRAATMYSPLGDHMAAAGTGDIDALEALVKQRDRR